MKSEDPGRHGTPYNQRLATWRIECASQWRRRRHSERPSKNRHVAKVVATGLYETISKTYEAQRFSCNQGRCRGGGAIDDVSSDGLLLPGLDVIGDSEPSGNAIVGAIQCARICGCIDGVVHIAASTCGDGACALHAVWGAADPSKHMELYAPNARAMVLSQIPEDALQVSKI